MTPLAKNRKHDSIKINNINDIALKPINRRVLNALLKSVVINYLVQNFSLIDNNRKIRELTESELNAIAEETNCFIFLVRKVVKEFTSNLVNFNKFLKNCKVRHDPKNSNKKVRTYLRKVYRLAPVFDYNRARKNLEILQFHLAQRGMWLKISSQLAIVMYATDKNEVNVRDKKIIQKRIIQKNILTMCCCSAFAFHRARNELRIK